MSPGNVTGTVVNGSGQALAGATVSAAGLSTTSGADGSYVLNNLPAGSTTIQASLTGFQSGSTTVTVVAAATTSAPAITLVSGSGSITGNVKTTAGAAIAGASVGFGGGTATTDANRKLHFNRSSGWDSATGRLSQRFPERDPERYGQRRKYQHRKLHTGSRRCYWSRDRQNHQCFQWSDCHWSNRKLERRIDHEQHEWHLYVNECYRRNAEHYCRQDRLLPHTSRLA